MRHLRQCSAADCSRTATQLVEKASLRSRLPGIKALRTVLRAANRTA